MSDGGEQRGAGSMDYWEDEENMTVEEYLLWKRGPKQLPLALILPITMVYTIILVLGVVGNFLVCMVIMKNLYMRTATNYHLFSLALSDLALLLLGLPNDLSVFWQQYPWSFGILACKMRALISEMTSYASVLTIVGFSMERYLAICKPLSKWRLSVPERALRLIVFSWMTSLLAASPFAAFTTVNYLDFPPGSGCILMDSAFCAMLDENIPKNFPIYEISTFVFFFLPLIIILFIYSKIAIVLRKRKEENLIINPGTTLLRKTKSKSSKSMDKMLVAVVVTFFICWAPFHAQRLLYLYGTSSPNYMVLNEWMYYITGIFYYVSSTINPILYNVMSMKYRKAFKETILGKKYRGENSSIRSVQ